MASLTLAVSLAVLSGTAGAQSVDAGTAQIEVVAGDGNQVEVVVSGLEEEIGGQLVVYQCGNVDAAGVSTAVTTASCFSVADGTERYVVVEITDATMRIPYEVVRGRSESIGAGDARCLQTAGLEPCELQVGVTADRQSVLVAVPLADPASSSSNGLAHTGLSGERTAALALVGLALVYAGWFAASSVPPQLRRS